MLLVVEPSTTFSSRVVTPRLSVLPLQMLPHLPRLTTSLPYGV